MTMPPQLLFGGPPPEPPSPEAAAKIRAYTDAMAEHETGWRRTLTGPWSFLWCTCASPFTFVAGTVYTEGCVVHGGFMVTPDGQVL